MSASQERRACFARLELSVVDDVLLWDILVSDMSGRATWKAS